MQITTEALLLGLTGIFTVLWWLLRNKDASQQKAIELIWMKFDTLAKETTDLRMHVAESHYKKPELDVKFDRLETSFRGGLGDLGIKMDRLTQTVREKS
jgi:hypothetical protein